MPDLSIVTSAICPDQLHFAVRLNNYSVSFDVFNRGQYQRNWHCTCKGFQFRKTCKHVEAAKLEQCQYDQQFDQPPHDGNCPHCRQKLEYQTLAI